MKLWFVSSKVVQQRVLKLYMFTPVIITAQFQVVITHMCHAIQAYLDDDDDDDEKIRHTGVLPRSVSLLYW